MGKKIALVQCAASAASTARVFFGQGPSSKGSTTSPSARNSKLLKRSNPKPGPAVVSTSTTREIPSASGLPGHEEPERATAAGTCTDAGVGATAPAGRAATDAGFSVDPEPGANLSPVVSTSGLPCSSTVVTTGPTDLSAGAVCAG